MKFITEEYLRDMYRKNRFTNFRLVEGQRLTPGASQFLRDKRIELCEDIQSLKDSIDNPKSKKDDNKERNINKRILYKIRTIEVDFLIKIREVIEDDIILAQNLMEISKEISSIKLLLSGDKSISLPNCKGCTGMNSKNFFEDIDDCFDITEFYMQLSKSKEILELHELRCKLRELEILIIEEFDGSEVDNEIGDKLIKYVNWFINSLSQIICSVVGGKVCQRKS